MSKKVVAKPSGAVAKRATSELDRLAQADTGAGFEEANRDAFAIPFLIALQDLSPQVKKMKPGFIPGAKPGQILQTVAQTVHDKMRVIPCYYSQSFIEWKPRTDGGGFVAAHPANTPLIRSGVRDRSKMILPNGNELIDTRQHFVWVIYPDGTQEGALLALKSTQIKVSKRWMSQQKSAFIEIDGRLVAPPSFAWSYRMTTIEDANDEGSWYSYVIDDRERVEDISIYRMAKAFKESMSSGSAKVNYDDLAPPPDTASPDDRQEDDFPTDIDA